MGLQKKKKPSPSPARFFFCVFFHQKFNGTESQRTPKSLARANTYSGLGVRSVSPVGDFLDFLTFTVSAIDFFLFGFLLDLDLLRFSGCFLLVEITSHLGTLVATAYASDTLLVYPRKNLQECSFKTPFSHRPGKTVPDKFFLSKKNTILLLGGSGYLVSG